MTKTFSICNLGCKVNMQSGGGGEKRQTRH